MKECVRILQVVTKMDRAGLENRLMDLYRTIDKTEFQFDFLTCSGLDGYHDEEIIKLGGKIHKISSLKIKYMWSFRKELKLFFMKHQEYKVVHCHLNQWCGLILECAKECGVKVRIAHSRTSLNRISFKNLVKNIIKIPTRKYATHKMAVSEYAGAWLFGKKAVYNNEVYILPNAIDMLKFTFNPEKRKEYRDKFNLEDNLTLIHVGNFKPEKNHMYLIKVFDSVKNIYPKSKLVLVGKDNMNGKIQKKVSEMGLENDVIILGSRSDVENCLSMGDIFVFPSYYEGFPGSVLEAQASGLPCVISDSITSEVCITGRITQCSLKDNPCKWAENIVDYYKKYGENREMNLTSSKYNINSSTSELINFYKKLM